MGDGVIMEEVDLLQPSLLLLLQPSSLLLPSLLPWLQQPLKYA
jgi:hypothetical protein